MEIFVNNREVTVPLECSVEDLLRIMGYHPYAPIWINGLQILRRDYPSRKIKDQDHIKIIRPLAGG
ncbi:sulfur carrier protein ThiS [Clostridiaceae bacterium 35-E11]